MEIDLVRTVDRKWQALYIDDKLILEGPRLDMLDVLEEVCGRLSDEVDIYLTDKWVDKKIQRIMPKSYQNLEKLN